MRRSVDMQDSPRSKQFGLHLQPLSARSMQKRKLSCEEIINEMEKEQDAQVMRLLREVDMLREENMQLRRQLCQGRQSLRPPLLQQTDRDVGFAANYDDDLNYHYGLSSGSARSSISCPQRKASPVSIPTTSQRGAAPIDTMIPTLSLSLKRGSTSAAPNSSSSSSVAVESDNNHQTLKNVLPELDPRQKVPRRWSSISDSHSPRNDSHADTAMRLREFEFGSSRV